MVWAPSWNIGPLSCRSLPSTFHHLPSDLQPPLHRAAEQRRNLLGRQLLRLLLALGRAIDAQRHVLVRHRNRALGAPRLGDVVLERRLLLLAAVAGRQHGHALAARGLFLHLVLARDLVGPAEGLVLA